MRHSLWYVRDVLFSVIKSGIQSRGETDCRYFRSSSVTGKCISYGIYDLCCGTSLGVCWFTHTKIWCLVSSFSRRLGEESFGPKSIRTHKVWSFRFPTHVGLFFSYLETLVMDPPNTLWSTSSSSLWLEKRTLQSRLKVGHGDFIKRADCANVRDSFRLPRYLR